MAQLNRRQWMRTAGLAGAFSLLGGTNLLEAKPSSARVPGDPKVDLARLSSNENPFGPSQKVREAMIKAFDDACRYPFSYGKELLEMIAKKEGVTPEHLVVTAGSTEGLKVTGLLYGMESGEIVSSKPTYLSLMSFAEKFGAYINWVPVKDDLGHDLEEMDRRITNRTSLVYVCNPDNPTGTLLPAKQLQDFCESTSKRTLTFVDEAYFDFITTPNYPSMIDLVRKGQNLIVARTFSKVYGLAGLRIGYLIARPDIAQRLREHVVANTNILAIAAAKTALEDKKFYDFSVEKNMEAKKLIYDTLDELKLAYQPSHTNFVFFRTGRDIGALNTEMRNEGVQIGRAFPPFTDHCRISTGRIEDVQKFCAGLKRVMG